MDKDLLVICPTRGRLESCARMIKSFDEMSSDCADLLFIIDHDDLNIFEYKELIARSKYGWFIRKKEPLCDIYNIIVTRWEISCDFYSITCDDYIYHTNNWDKILMQKLIDKGGGFAYGDDGYNHGAVPTTCIISGEIVRALEWIVEPSLKYLCGDLVWKDLGHALNRLYYVPEVKIEHMTPWAGKAEADETFKRTNSDENFTVDNKSYRTWKSNQMLLDVAKIRKALE